MTSDFIVDVSEANFEYEVLAYSQQTPVVVDFWAEWCGPCRMLGPLLERLANEAQGGFRLAKVNVDENPNLALRYAVRSIPVVKAFRDGRMIAELVGAQPEPRVREFLHGVSPSPMDLALNRGFSYLEQGQVQPAEQAFRKVLQAAPEHTAARLGLAKSLLRQGVVQEAYTLLNQFPASREFSATETLLPLAQFLMEMEKVQAPAGDDPYDAAFYQALRLFKRGNPEAAMDGLLDILRENKRYREGAARKAMVAILELLGETHPATRQYRSELSSVLF